MVNHWSRVLRNFLFHLIQLANAERIHTVWYVAFVLVLFMMIVNGLSNYVIFRLQNLGLWFIIGTVCPIFDVTLFLLLTKLDSIAAWYMVPTCFIASTPFGGAMPCGE